MDSGKRKNSKRKVTVTRDETYNDKTRGNLSIFILTYTYVYAYPFPFAFIIVLTSASPISPISGELELRITLEIQKALSKSIHSRNIDDFTKLLFSTARTTFLRVSLCRKRREITHK
eukprot:Pgem_evm1s11428